MVGWVRTQQLVVNLLLFMDNSYKYLLMLQVQKCMLGAKDRIPLVGIVPNILYLAFVSEHSCIDPLSTRKDSQLLDEHVNC